MRLKRALAQTEDSLHAIRASAADWLRDGFGPQAGFSAFVAEGENAEAIFGMATASAPVFDRCARRSGVGDARRPRQG